MTFSVEYFSLAGNQLITLLASSRYAFNLLKHAQEGDGMRRIPEEFVEALQQRIDIVDIVGEHVQLRRSGRSFMGLCPFHNERSPSFSVSPDRQMFHCFGCGAGGTAIRFVMDIEGLTFVEAVVRLAERVNMTLPVELEEVGVPSSEAERLERMKEAHELAAKFYSYILMNSATGVQALTYLENRGIERTTIAEFRLGYSPNTERRLVDFLVKRGFPVDLLVDCGLAVSLGERVVDRFRHRVMIPISDGRGQVVAFGGRSLSAEAKPKYLNSPETPLFHKSRVLFNLHTARKAIRQSRTAVVFEGYMDVISAWQAGVQSGVASMGTSLTEEQLTILKRYADRITVAYDGDAAGKRATRRALDIARSVRMECRVVQFPDGLDPDDFIRQRGGPAFTRQFESKLLTEVQYLMQTLREEARLESPAGRTEYVRSALQLLAERATPIERDEELQKIALEFHFSMDTLQQEMRTVKPSPTKRAEKREFDASPRAQSPASLVPAEVRAGNYILKSLLLEQATAAWLEDKGVMELPTAEQTALLARLYAFRFEHPDGSAASFMNGLDDAELLRLASGLAMEDAPNFDEDVLLDCLRSIRLHQLDTRYRQALQELLDAQVEGRLDEVDAFRSEVEALQQQIAQCKTPRWRNEASIGAKEAGKE